MHETDDIELLRRYADENSEAAFAALVERHINLVYSTALRHAGNPHHAEEITQAVFVILARKCGQLRRGVVVSGWLYHAARLTAANFLRSETQRIRREQEAYMQSNPSETETEVWLRLAPLLDKAMAGLGEKDRDAVVLRFFEGKKMHEVGVALGINEEAAKKRTARAVEKLRRFFTKRGVVVPAAIFAAAVSANTVQAAPVTLGKTITAVAVTKGAASSVSTLTLIKGAMKFMAWTKAKTAIVAGVVVLLTAGTTGVIITEMRSASSGPRTTAATERIKGQLFTLPQLVDAGNTTPEAAWESRYWARSKGDYDAVIAATLPQAVSGAKAWMGDKATFRDRSKTEFNSSFKGFQILARKDLASDQVELKYQFAFETPDTKIVVMAKVNGAWRCAETRAYDAGWDEGSALESQP